MHSERGKKADKMMVGQQPGTEVVPLAENLPKQAHNESMYSSVDSFVPGTVDKPSFFPPIYQMSLNKGILFLI